MLQSQKDFLKFIQQESKRENTGKVKSQTCYISISFYDFLLSSLNKGIPFISPRGWPSTTTATHTNISLSSKENSLRVIDSLKTTTTFHYDVRSA